MRMTRQQMDQLVNEHFGFEAADDVEGVLASLADEVRHEVVPSPMGAQTDKAAIRDFYRMLFADLKGEGVTPLRRLYGEDFVVDEALWNGRVVNGRPFLMDGKSGKVARRLVTRRAGRQSLRPSCFRSPCRLAVFAVPSLCRLMGGTVRSKRVWSSDDAQVTRNARL